MQLKHTLLASALVAGFVLPASAHEITIALGGLGSSLSAQETFQDTGLGIDITRNSGQATTLGGEASAAYVWNVNSGFDIGFEFFYSFTGNNLIVYNDDGTTTTVNNIWGFRGLPAFHITNNTKIYIDLGYAIVDQTFNVANAPLLDPSFTTTSVKSSYQGGFQYGAGIETMIYNSIAIRLAYTAQESRSVSLSGNAGTPSADQTFSSTPTVYSFFFGGAYHFQF